MQKLAGKTTIDGQTRSFHSFVAVEQDVHKLSSEKSSSLSSVSTLSTQSVSSKLLETSPLSLPCIETWSLCSIQSKAPVTSLAVCGKHLYAAHSNVVVVYDLNTFTIAHTLSEPTSSSGSVKAFAFCGIKEQSLIVLTGHQDAKIRGWKLVDSPSMSHRLCMTLPKLTDRVCRFMHPGNYVAVRRHVKKLWIQHTDAITGLAVSRSDTTLVYSASWDKTLKVWNASAGFRCVESITAHEDSVNAVVVSDDGTVYTASADCKIRVWSRKGKRHVLERTLEKHTSAVNALALNSDGSRLFSGGCDKSIRVWAREGSAFHMIAIESLMGHKMAILCLVNASQFLLSASADRTVRIWDCVGKQHYSCLAVLDGHLGPVKSLAVSWDADVDVLWVYSGTLDGEIIARRVTFDYTQATD